MRNSICLMSNLLRKGLWMLLEASAKWRHGDDNERQTGSSVNEQHVRSEVYFQPAGHTVTLGSFSRRQRHLILQTALSTNVEKMKSLEKKGDERQFKDCFKRLLRPNHSGQVDQRDVHLPALSRLTVTSWPPSALLLWSKHSLVKDTGWLL